MALSIEQTKEIIRGSKNLDPAISDIKFANEGGSQTGIANAFAYLHALASNLLSQLFDKFQSDITTQLALNVAAVPLWIKKKVFEFQAGYQATINTSTFIVSYAKIDLVTRIVTQCSVKTAINGQVNIKVAKGGSTPLALTTSELNELKSYYDLINPAGIVVQFISKNADRLFVKAGIYYNGQYDSVIQANVKLAITSYLASLPFDGSMLISDLETALRLVEGVKDVVFEKIYARAVETLYSSSTKMIEAYKLTSISNRKWETVSGYMIPEDTSGFTLTDSLSFSIDG